MLEGGEGGVGPAFGSAVREPAIREASGEDGAEAVGGGCGCARCDFGVGEEGLVGCEVEREGGVAVAEIAGDLEDGGAAEASVGEEELLAEGWRCGATDLAMGIARAVSGVSVAGVSRCRRGDHFGGDAGDFAPESEVGWWKGEGNEGGSGGDDGDLEVPGDLVADAGGADLGDGEAAGGDDEGLGAEVFGLAVSVGGDDEPGSGVRGGDDLGAELELDVAGGGALALEEGDDVLGGAVAEELAEGLLVPGDAVMLDEGEEVLRGVAGEGGAGEVRIGGEEVFGLGVEVGEVGAAAAGDEDFAAGSVGVVKDEDLAAAAGGNGGAEEAGGSGAEDDDVWLGQISLPFASSRIGWGGRGPLPPPPRRGIF